MSVLSLTRAEARALDQAALAEYGIPSLVLMEHAGRSIAELARAVALERGLPRRATLFCGGGNNGGDGFVIARFLDLFGFEVECVCLESLEATRGDARVEREITARSGIALLDAWIDSSLSAQHERLVREALPRLQVDALLGTGFQGKLKPHVARAIAAVNDVRARTGAVTLAVDLPSGLDCDTGTVADPTIQADVTATCVARKRGFDAPAASAVLGRVEVMSIGVPRALLERLKNRADATRTRST